ncbi:sucrase-isomaltase, intestinal-like isoform X2 [Apostichopus japonicus]|uniref:sucrase-isomaltase, intestinal-like isoform X2 n=1 Tax=Stichopus japonicus TaxID=307972 RepID=UPI003AB64CEC
MSLFWRMGIIANLILQFHKITNEVLEDTSPEDRVYIQSATSYDIYRCPTELTETEREDCHPEEGASESACTARGCEWCEAETQGVPWCFYNTNPMECPTGVSSKADCLVGETVPSCSKCVNKDACGYCPDETPGVPWCFYHEHVDCQADTQIDFERVDCHPDAETVTKSSCENRGCVWCPISNQGVPWCYYPEDYKTYAITGQYSTAKGSRVTLSYQGGSGIFSAPATSLTVDVEYQTEDRLRVKIYDTNNARFEVPFQIPSPSAKASNPKYSITFGDTPNFYFKVTRNSNGEVLFDSSLSGFTFEDQFIQIGTKLPVGSYLYGFGETEHHSLYHDMNWKKYGMWSRDNPPDNDVNIYGVHPYYTVVSGVNTHGVLILNSNAQDVEMSPLPYVNFRTIGGILDFYFFLGPTPEDVVSQYTEAVGRPYFPPYWSLGFQLSRWGYGSQSVLKGTVDRMRSYQIPYDVQYGDIDYMDNQRDFTYDQVNFAGLPAYVNTLHESYGMKYIIILDPCIDITVSNYPAYEEGMTENIWVQNAGAPASAKVWPPGTCYFPDYFLASTQSWWTKQCSDFHNVIDYDGLWIDMNEPANFVDGTLDGCPYNTYNNPPYKPRVLGSVLAEKTTCPDSTQDNGSQLHYDVHSLYGLSQAIQTVPAMRTAIGGKRGIVISRSTFPGIGQYAGHWLGDNWSKWSNLAYSIIGSLEFNMFGIPYIGADICGFNLDATEEMCQRWMQLGAFYTFSRNHNGLNWKEQDPAVWGPELARVSRETLEIRYSLLPYLYTLFYHSHLSGSTVMRPLFHEFYDDEGSMTIDRQFLWGPAFMISPVLDEGAVAVNAYFPNAKWYDYYTGMSVSARGSYDLLSAPLDYIPLHIRGGYILPTQEPAVTTFYSRQNPMGLIVALDDYGHAEGDLFWDEGDTVDTIENSEFFYATFIADQNSLTSSVVEDNYTGVNSLVWGTIQVYGVSSSVSGVTVNGNPATYSYDIARQVLEVTNIDTFGITINTPLNVLW